MPNSFLFPPIQEPPASGTSSSPSLIKLRDGEKTSRHGTSPPEATGIAQTRHSHQPLSDANDEHPRATAWSHRTSVAASAATPGLMPATRFQAQAFTPFWVPGAATVAAYDALCRDGQDGSAPRLAEIVGNATMVKMLYQWAAAPGQASYVDYMHRLVLWVLETLQAVSALTRDSDTHPAQLGCTAIDSGTREPLAPEERQAFDMLRERASRLHLAQYRLALNENQTMTVFARYPFKSEQVPRMAFHLADLPHKDLHTLLQELVEHVEDLGKATTPRPEKRKAAEPLQDARRGARQPRQVFTYHPGNMPALARTGARIGATPVSPVVYRYEGRGDGPGMAVPMAGRGRAGHVPSAGTDMAQPADPGISMLGSTIPMAMLLNPPESPLVPPAVSPPVTSSPRRTGRQPTARPVPAPMPPSAPLHSDMAQPPVPTIPHITLAQAVPSPRHPGRPRAERPKAAARLQPIQPAPVRPPAVVPHRDRVPPLRAPHQQMAEAMLPGCAGRPVEPAIASTGPSRDIEIAGGLADIERARQDYLRFTGQAHCTQQDFYRGLLKLCLSARHAPERKTRLVDMGSIGEHAPAHYFIELVPGRRIVLIAAIAQMDGVETFALAHLLYQPTDRTIRRTSSKMMDAMLLGRR